MAKNPNDKLFVSRGTMARVHAATRAYERSISETNSVPKPTRDGGYPVVLRVYSVQDDHLVCRTWDGIQAGEDDILVAKPYLLRRTPFDGLTIADAAGTDLSYDYSSATAREVTYDSTTVDQQITPDYNPRTLLYAGDIIKARPIGEDMSVTAGQVFLEDENRDGRAWGVVE